MRTAPAAIILASLACLSRTASSAAPRGVPAPLAPELGLPPAAAGLPRDATAAAAPGRIVVAGPNAFPLELSPSLEPRRAEFAASMNRGYRIIADFAAAHGWSSHMRQPYVDSAWIFDKKAGYDDRLRRLLGAPADTQIPPSFTGALERRNYVTVAPEIIAGVAPAVVEDGFYDKLFAHEIAHRLHVRILGGDEEAMGPIWFFEGFAVLAAGQYGEHRISGSAALSVIGSRERGDYRAYGAVMRRLLAKTTLRELVARAGRPGFVPWAYSVLAGR